MIHVEIRGISRVNWTDTMRTLEDIMIHVGGISRVQWGLGVVQFIDKRHLFHIFKALMH